MNRLVNQSKPSALSGLLSYHWPLFKASVHKPKHGRRASINDSQDHAPFARLESKEWVDWLRWMFGASFPMPYSLHTGPYPHKLADCRGGQGY